MGAIHSTKIPTGPTGKRGPPQKVDPFFETFPVGPNRSIEFWTEISGKFGWMDRAQCNYSSTSQHFWPDSGQILRHQYGISVAESRTFLRAKRPQQRRARRNDVFAGYHLSRGNFCQSMSLFNEPCCLWSSSLQGTFSAIGTHHEGFHLSPFTDLLCIHGYHPTLYSWTFIKRPPICEQPSFIKRPVIKVPK